MKIGSILDDRLAWGDDGGSQSSFRFDAPFLLDPIRWKRRVSKGRNEEKKNEKGAGPASAANGIDGVATLLMKSSPARRAS